MFDVKHPVDRLRRPFSPTRFAASTLVLALALALMAPATAHAQIDPFRVDSGTVGLIDGQYARLNVYFVATEPSRPELPPGPCRVTIRFLDAAGATLAESVQTLAPNRDTLFDYRPAGLQPGERAAVRVAVFGERDAYGRAPLLIPTLEVVDVATARTTIASPGKIRGFNPQPEPPGDLGTFGAASLQVARLSASYVGLRSDSGLPPGPCNVLLTIFSGNGSILVSRQLTVAPGETVALDFATGFMVAGVRRRMWATVTTDGREQGFITASVEIFDEPTGKSSVLFPADFVQSWGWE